MASGMEIRSVSCQECNQHRGCRQWKGTLKWISQLLKIQRKEILQ